jgi:tRNA A37 N6-isopentenylltransferase MiaA
VALDVPLEELDRRIEARTKEMVRHGAIEEARRAWSRPLSATARKILGLEEFATLDEATAIDTVISATRKLARYQRKWLRKLPNVVTVDGRQPLGELADAVVALERSREHLSRH